MNTTCLGIPFHPTHSHHPRLRCLVLALATPLACMDEADLDLADDAFGDESETGEALEPEFEDGVTEPDLGDGFDPMSELDIDAEDPEPGIPVLSQSELSTLLLGASYTYTSLYNPNANGHAGVDIGGAGDGVTTVRSPVSGTVTANTTACGKVTVFDGVNTIIMAHMSNLSAPAVGQPIAIGAAVGKVSMVVGGGCSASGPHLHLEIRKGNNTSMANPAVNNTTTTLNPLTYTYSPFNAVSLSSPAANATLYASPMNFSWAAQQGATSYRLQISTSNSFTAETCTNGCIYNTAASSTSRSVGLGIGTYYWRVRAGNSGQGGYWSSVRMVRRA